MVPRVKAYLRVARDGIHIVVGCDVPHHHVASGVDSKTEVTVTGVGGSGGWCECEIDESRSGKSINPSELGTRERRVVDPGLDGQTSCVPLRTGQTCCGGAHVVASRPVEVNRPLLVKVGEWTLCDYGHRAGRRESQSVSRLDQAVRPRVLIRRLDLRPGCEDHGV